MVNPSLPLVSDLLQRMFQTIQKTEEPQYKERITRKGRKKELPQVMLGILLSLTKFLLPLLILRQLPNHQKMLIFLLMFCYLQLQTLSS